MDRRIKKTKRALSQALVDLILEKGYESVTVQDILEKADVGRSTFYAHYENKDLLLKDGPRNLGFSLFEDPKPKEPGLGLRPLFQHVSENLPLAKATLGKKSGTILIGSFQHQLSEAIASRYSARFAKGRERILLRYMSDAAAAAACSLLTNWVDRDLDLAVDEILGRCQRMIEGMFGNAAA